MVLMLVVGAGDELRRARIEFGGGDDAGIEQQALERGEPALMVARAVPVRLGGGDLGGRAVAEGIPGVAPVVDERDRHAEDASLPGGRQDEFAVLARPPPRAATRTQPTQRPAGQTGFLNAHERHAIIGPQAYYRCVDQPSRTRRPVRLGRLTCWSPTAVWQVVATMLVETVYDPVNGGGRSDGPCPIAPPRRAPTRASLSISRRSAHPPVRVGVGNAAASSGRCPIRFRLAQAPGHRGHPRDKP